MFIFKSVIYQILTGTYAEALKKLKKSEETSNLESDAEALGGPSTKRLRLREVKKRRSSASSTSSSQSSVSSVGGQVSAPSFPSLSLVDTSSLGIRSKLGNFNVHLITNIGRKN